MERGGGVVGSRSPHHSRRGAQLWGGVETGLSVVDSVFPGCLLDLSFGCSQR
jgi:hypothetical protein